MKALITAAIIIILASMYGKAQTNKYITIIDSNLYQQTSINKQVKEILQTGTKQDQLQAVGEIDSLLVLMLSNDTDVQDIQITDIENGIVYAGIAYKNGEFQFIPIDRIFTLYTYITH